MARKQVAKTKIKKKHWVPIHAPQSFDGVLLGETLVTETEQVSTKSVTMNLMILLDDPRKQQYTIRFDVTRVKDGRADTQVIGLRMTNPGIRRLIRRNRDKIDDSFVVRIAGDRLVRVKPMIVTQNKSSKAAQTEIRLKVREKLREHYAKMRFDAIVQEAIQIKTQRLLKDICSNTHPIRTAEIRELIVLPQDRKLDQEMLDKIEKEAAEEEEKRQQIASAAAVASVEVEDVKPKKKVVKKKAVKKETAEEASEE
jgi:ribosomal protein S3AE